MIIIVVGNVIFVFFVVRIRMIMLEKLNDGIVVMYYGDLDDGDFMNVENYLFILFNIVSF